MKKYTNSFLFSRNGKQVALIRKIKPTWQSGLLNGVGGKVESGENPEDTNVREFWEETGLKTSVDDWKHFLTMGGGDFSVDFFVGMGDLSLLKTTTEENVEIVEVESIFKRNDIIKNLIWLIPLAYDVLSRNEPKFVNVTY